MYGWLKAKEARCTVDNKEIVNNYKLFEFYEDQYVDNSEYALPGPDGKKVSHIDGPSQT